MEMNQRLDAEDFAADEMVTFNVPLAVPYYNDSRDYERVSGAFEHNGEFFRLVKEKLQRDTLYIVCIKDHKEKRLFNALTDFVKLSHELPASSQQTLKLLGSFSKDFFPTSSINTPARENCLLCVNFSSQQFDLLINDFPVFSPPPDLMSSK